MHPWTFGDGRQKIEKYKSSPSRRIRRNTSAPSTSGENNASDDDVEACLVRLSNPSDSERDEPNALQPNATDGEVNDIPNAQPDPGEPPPPSEKERRAGDEVSDIPSVHNEGSFRIVSG